VQYGAVTARKGPRHPPGDGRGRGIRIYRYWPVRTASGFIQLYEEPPEGGGQPFITTLSPEDMDNAKLFRNGNQQAWVKEMMNGMIGEDG
jgi:hypothetical protein